ncbi:MAG: 2-oxoacid:ferredoxin oxidoreductase subunit beta [Nitrospinae bacterium]|nr:2-oxoacid:ferredoxin oxidoreductase subunit beta [Nitrospinota bacterium]
MSATSEFHYERETSWCPGCGDFQILKSVEQALVALGKKPGEVLVVSGIGQAAKLPHYLNANGFNGLHGRALPPAFGAKCANHELTVLVTTGDGDCYGEGGNHFIHAIRRNIDITVIVHNNQIYGLTKGQASPTSDIGFVTKTQPGGVVLTPFNPLAVAISLEAAFVARAFSKDTDHVASLIVEGVKTPGFALIDVLQPCVSFNKVNTYQWYQQRVYRLDEDGYDPADKLKAFEKALEWGERIPTGVLYKNPRAESYLDHFIKPGEKPLVKRERPRGEIEALVNEFYSEI